MKKYLVKGALALFGGAFLFSCAEKESEYVPLAQQKVKAFEEVFKEVYGDNIDPYQRWGFTDKMEIANGDDVEPTEVDEVVITRSFRAGTRSIDVNGNLWKDCPEVGTKEEADVLAYLSTLQTKEKNPVRLQNYFVTQIHKGTQDYWNVGGGYVGVGSGKMNNLHIAMSDGLTINNGALSAEGATAWDHINNFNAGNCTDWSAGIDGKGNTMVINGGTFDFAYQGADDSKYHNRWCSIDGANVPRTDGKGTNYAGYYYICFDFEQDAPTKTVFYIDFQWTHVAGGGHMQTDNKSIEYKIDGSYDNDHKSDIVTAMGGKFTYEGQEYELTANMIRVANIEGANQNVTPNSDYKDWIVRLVEAEKEEDPQEPQEPEDPQVPEEPEHEYGTGSEPKTWNDNVYEWDQVTTQSGRVFCEDLGVAAREDLDYNDVVFDVIIWKYSHYLQPMKSTITWTTTDGVKDEGSDTESTPETNGVRREVEEDATYFAQIQLLAAGGTIPLTVGKKDGYNVEVHNAFGVGLTTMVNTRDANSTAFGAYEAKNPVDIGNIVREVAYDGKTQNLKLIEGISKAADVQIVVNYNGIDINELDAKPGKAPHKLFVPFNTRWASERKPLNLAYPYFGNYVNDASKSWVNTFNNDCLYSGTTPGLANMPPVIKIKQISDVESMPVLTDQSYEYTSSWELKDIYLKDVDNFYPNGELCFYPGDRLRFYGSGINQDSYITVVFANNSKPYFIDTIFAESDKKGNYPSTACIEVLLDEDTCQKLNSSKKDGKLMLWVQGRSFTLTQIGIVPFK